MKRFLLLFILATSLMIVEANTVMVSKEDALAVVKQQMDNNPFDYYVASLTSVYDDGEGSCLIDSIPDIEWLKSTEGKWLFFVDEKPSTNWNHKCSFFYVPQEISAVYEDEIPFVKFNGVCYPRGIDLQLIETSRDTTYKTAQALPLYYAAEEDTTDIGWIFDHTYFSNSTLLMIGGGMNPDNNATAYINDCRYFYDVMAKKGNLPIGCRTYLCFGGGGGCTTSEGTQVPYGFCYGDRYVDMQPAKYKNIVDVFDEICRDSKDTTGGLQNYAISNLIVFITCHGGVDKKGGYINLWSGYSYEYNKWEKHKLYAYELKQMLDSINSLHQTIILGNCYSGTFVETLKAPGRVIISACGPDEESHGGSVSDTGYNFNYFVNHFTNAINGADYLGNLVDADYDHDGSVSLKEAYDYARVRATADAGQKEHAMYSSTPSWVGNDITIGKYRDHSNLYIRDNLLDSANMRSASGENCWNSPDIWVRNQADGFENTCSEPLAANSDTAYIYTRIGNLGMRDFLCSDNPKYLELFWAKPSLTTDSSNWQGCNGGLIDKQLLAADIAADSSAVICTPWTIPIAYRNANASKSGNVGVLARISDGRGCMEDVIPNLPQSLKEVTLSRYLAEKNKIILNADSKDSKIAINLKNTSDTLQKLSIFAKADSVNGGDATKIGNVEIYAQLSPSQYQKWVEGGKRGSNIEQASTDSTNIRVLGLGSSIEGIELAPGQVDSIVVSCNIAAANYVKVGTVSFDLVAINEEQKPVGASAVAIKFDSRSAIQPGIDVGDTSTEGGSTDSAGGSIGSVMMTATNIQEPVDYEWSDPDGTVIGNSRNVVLSEIKKGFYKLRVVAQSDGAAAYATAEVSANAQSVIKSVSPNPFTDNITVTFSSVRSGNETVKITSVSGSSLPISKQCEKGASALSISTAELPQGQYLVSLIINNNVVETVHATKQ